MNQAMLELYQKEKINPLGGCLPMLVQIPVFFALYWVLLESVELRQAPFILWIQNLSAPDPVLRAAGAERPCDDRDAAAHAVAPAWTRCRRR